MKKFRFGLIGNNVTYSKSADIFKAVFKQHDIDGSCEVFNICPDEFNQKFQSITGSAVDGDRKSTRLNSSHTDISRMPSSA